MAYGFMSAHCRAVDRIINDPGTPRIDDRLEQDISPKYVMMRCSLQDYMNNYPGLFLIDVLHHMVQIPCFAVYTAVVIMGLMTNQMDEHGVVTNIPPATFLKKFFPLAHGVSFAMGPVKYTVYQFTDLPQSQKAPVSGAIQFTVMAVVFCVGYRTMKELNMQLYVVGKFIRAIFFGTALMMAIILNICNIDSVAGG